MDKSCSSVPSIRYKIESRKGSTRLFYRIVGIFADLTTISPYIHGDNSIVGGPYARCWAPIFHTDILYRLRGISSKMRTTAIRFHLAPGIGQGFVPFGFP
jgi:hypothetical protein